MHLHDRFLQRMLLLLRKCPDASPDPRASYLPNTTGSLNPRLWWIKNGRLVREVGSGTFLLGRTSTRGKVYYGMTRINNAFPSMSKTPFDSSPFLGIVKSESGPCMQRVLFDRHLLLRPRHLPKFVGAQSPSHPLALVRSPPSASKAAMHHSNSHTPSAASISAVVFFL